MKRYLLLLLLCTSTLTASPYFPTFWDWKEACDHLPSFEESEAQTAVTPLTWELFKDEIDQYTLLMKKRLFSRTEWLHHAGPSHAFFDDLADPFEPYVERLLLAPGSKIAIHGDFHGDVRSLNRFLAKWAEEGYLSPYDPFVITDPNFYILFLGDYTDRGWYGAETIYTILRLKRLNPDQVFLVRGNHEDAGLASRYGFEEELRTKFLFANPQTVYRLYNYLPVALYLGSGDTDHLDYALCCHGGLEVGYDPRALLQAGAEVRYEHLSMLMRLSGMIPFIDRYGLSPLWEADPDGSYFRDGMVPTSAIGFLWSDFSVDTTTLIAPSGRGKSVLQFGKRATEALLESWGITHGFHETKVQTVLRAHQHTSDLRAPIMRRIYNLDLAGHVEDSGIGKMWVSEMPYHSEHAGSMEGIRAVTFAAAPEQLMELPYDAFGLLTVERFYRDWHLRTVRIPLPTTR